MEQISLFEKSSSVHQVEELSVRSFLKRVKSGYWKKHQLKVRNAKGKEEKKKVKRFSTPGVTICGVFPKKRVGVPVKPSGYICIDVDADDNKDILDKRQDLENDPYVFGVFSSISGTGLALIFKIKPKQHRELFNGIQDYLYKEYGIVVDPLARDQARLRYVSYDPECYYNFKKKPFPHAVISTPTPVISDEEHSEEDIEDLVIQIEKDDVDIVPRYHEWYIVGQALARLGEKGRKFFHRISKIGETYDKNECDFQFDNCLAQESRGTSDKRVGLGSVFFFAKENGVILATKGPKIVSSKKQKIVQEHNEEVMLSLEGHKLDKGIYTYHIWMFKALFKKEAGVDIECLGLNAEAVSDFLFNSGIRRSGRTFYKVNGNIVEIVTLDSILDMVVQEGVRLPKDFKLKWDEESDVIIRKSILDKVQSGGRKVLEGNIILKEFVPDNEEFISDTETDCFLFFKNGIVQINSKAGKSKKEGQHQLIPWEDVRDRFGCKYVWKENIVDRDFVFTKKKSQIQEILENAIGKKYWDDVQSAIGYMVHTYIPEQGTEILFCIDRNVGDLNEGGNGKDFFSQVIKHTRKLTNIPGKTLNFNSQFTFERMDKDTQVMWIEDLGKHIKMEMLYNLNSGVSVRKMHTPPFTVRCKIGISLQHLINIEGSSDQRRQIFLLFTDFYSKHGGIGKYHKDKNILGTTWNGWDEYYTMIVKCVQHYLKNGLSRMDIAPLLELRMQELSDGSFEALQPGTWYSTEAAIELCWGKETVINTETFISFRKKLAQWCKLSGYIIEAERKSLNGKQQKAIRIIAPMKVIYKKKSK